MKTLAIILALTIPAVASAETLTLKTAAATFGVDEHGSLVSISGSGHNYIAAGQPAPLLQLRVGGKWVTPQSANWDATTSQLALHYADGISATVKMLEKKTHVTLEVVDVKPKDKVELALWGPYPTTIGDIIGECVGVVRDSRWAIGIQALNAKTLGGYPKAESDINDGAAHDDPGHYADLPPELNKGQNFRGNTAWPTAFGSVLQAYCRDRGHERVISNWGHARFIAPAFNDGGIVGSKIALFSCPSERVLATIGEIEVAEGLPHPLLDGVWAKTAPQANASYMIIDFDENNIDQAIAMTKAAGLNYLYHSSAFQTWGHFQLKPNLFPHGPDGLRTCVDNARTAGVRVGFHTLSNFITPNDAYVTPKPDHRLARIGSNPLSAGIDATAKEIPLESADFFRKSTTLNTAVIGDELVRYASVDKDRLLGCRRGAWGTTAAAHRRGDLAGKLLDHPYQVFLTEADLSQEVARNIAKLCNHAGIRQISMDGLEGNWSTGHGQYGRVLFAQAWYDALDPALRGEVRNDASNPAHFNWHINTYYNWGEPWYAGFRESQTLYRFENQLFYTRNFLPRMLGWFALRRETTLADAEWLLARAAGYDAGFALATSFASAAQQKAGSVSAMNTRTAAIFEAVKQWESARLAGAFPVEVRAQLRDNHREFHLEPTGPRQWDLYPIESGSRATSIRLKAK